MISVSEYFKNRREELGISIPQIGVNLNIRPEYLEAIEKEDDSIFVSDVYRKGFVKLYAKYLGLNEEYALALDRRTHKLDLNKGVVNLEKKSFFSSNTFKISTFVVFFILFLSGVFATFYIQAQRYNDIPTIYLRQPINQEYKSDGKNEININYTSNTDSIDILGKVDPEVKIFINDRQQPLDALGEFSIPKKVIFNGQNKFTFKAQNKIGKQTIVHLNVSYSGVK